ncbi:MAG: type II secretion system F family protein [Buchananella hordeovulneris]|nr:type II secretion system F family protein [Buchananella hordeovulneris]
MGVIVGLLGGSGLLLIWWAVVEPTPQRSRRQSAWGARVKDLLIQAGFKRATAGQLLAVCAGVGVTVTLAGWVLTTALPVGASLGVLASLIPLAVVGGRARRRREELRSLWPDVVDDILSSVRAGASLPETLVSQAERGPELLRPAFQEYAAYLRATGRFDSALDVLKASVADPVADRLVEALRLARSVGGADLGKLLRALSEMLRADLRTRGELQARQSWTVNGARVAAVAPWLVLLLLATRPEAISAFRSSQGALVLLVGALATAFAYVAMIRLGRLPEEKRVLR